ncbi:unnamed protein product [Leptosia nina]|uniref:Uncharacterized protein n=1 Tax=Leptosia nina TaxID=320188 RepID=A0AAV1IVI2_9NEOP
MLRIFILTITLCVTNTQKTYSAASESQIRFALENKYDNTGPGAKGPEYAYNTYKTLEEALVSYVGDPDTKLPEHERAKVERYVNTDLSQPIRELPKTVEEYTGLKQPSRQRPTQVIQSPFQPQPISQQESFISQPLQYEQVFLQEPAFQTYPTYKHKQSFFQDPSSKYSFLDFRSSDLRQGLQNEKLEYKLRVPPVRPLGQVNKDLAYDSNPQYSFSYGVHDRKTGDSKSAHESRDGGSVQGFYTFMDPDGKQRTVHYTADDKFGFRATVQRTHMNTQ